MIKEIVIGVSAAALIGVLCVWMPLHLDKLDREYDATCQSKGGVPHHFGVRDGSICIKPSAEIPME